MASKPISDLTELTTPADDDELAIVDTSASETKRITKANLLGVILPLTIDLSAQCNGTLTVFDLGRSVKALICVSLNDLFTSSSLHVDTDKITLDFAPDSGEELKAITLIHN